MKQLKSYKSSLTFYYYVLECVLQGIEFKFHAMKIYVFNSTFKICTLKATSHNQTAMMKFLDSGDLRV